MNKNALSVNVVQNSAGPSVETNLQRIDELLASADQADVIVLPELFCARTSLSEQRDLAESADGPVHQWLSGLARRHQSWVIGGSLLEKTEGGMYNASVVYDREGHEAARYRKMHLFDVDLSDGTSLRESNQYLPGAGPVSVNMEHWCAGLAICYDLRFPELFRKYAEVPADIIFLPSNFTAFTGRMHWKPLLQARAIENQCFIVAANQCGKHPVNEVLSYGHSLVVDPFGCIISEAGEEESVFKVDCDPARIDEFRRQIPALKHRRL
jgi:nitrilase